MILAERDRELAYLRVLFAECQSGHGRVVVINGSVSSGKTELLHRFAAEVEEADALVVQAVAVGAERSLPLGVMGQLFRRLDLPGDEFDKVSRLLDDGTFTAMLTEPEPNTVHQVPPHVLLGLCTVLLELAARQPLVITVDDVHNADGPSLQCLSYLIRRIGPACAMIVLTESVRPQPAHPTFHADLLAQPHCRRIRLALLSPSGVRAVLDERLGPGHPADLAAEFHSVTGGNPLLLRALIEDFRPGSTRGPDEVHVGAAFSQAVLSCIYRCEESMRKLARGLAVIGENGTPALLARLLDREPASAVRALNALEATGLLVGRRFRHRDARVAVLDAMAPEERAATHGRLAHLLHNDGAAATVVAQHILEADHVEGAWVMPVLHEAADVALSVGKTELALRCLRLGLSIAASPAEQATTLAMLATVEWRVNPSIAIRHVSELLVAVRAGHLTGRLATAPIEWLLWFGRVDEAIDAMELLNQSVDHSDTESAAAIASTRMRILYMYPSVADAVAVPEQHAIADTTSAAVSPDVRAARVLADVLCGQSPDATSGAEQILQAYHLNQRTWSPLGSALTALIYGDRLTLAAMWCEKLLSAAKDQQVPAWQALFSSLRADIALRQGDLRAAAQHARIALTVVSPKSWGVVIGTPLSLLLQASIEMGRLDDALNHLRIPVPDAMFQSTFGINYLDARGHYYNASGRYTSALDDFQTCGELMARWNMDSPVLVPWRTNAARSLLHLGETQRARKLVEEQLRMLGPTHGRARSISLRVLAEASPASARPALLNQGIESLRQCGDRLGLAHLLTDLSEAHRQIGEFSQARTIGRRARDVAEECGAAPLLPEPGRAMIGPDLAATAERTVETGTVQPALGLSDAEHRVAALAALGFTNRQIAGKLSVTVSTVEQHLTRIYRKLNVSRRTDLPLKVMTGGVAERER